MSALPLLANFSRVISNWNLVSAKNATISKERGTIYIWAINCRGWESKINTESMTDKKKIEKFKVFFIKYSAKEKIRLL